MRCDGAVFNRGDRRFRRLFIRFGDPQAFPDKRRRQRDFLRRADGDTAVQRAPLAAGQDIA